MSKYRKKPVVIEATQWFKNGDHPDDAVILLQPPGHLRSEGAVDGYSEGKVIKRFRVPGIWP